jgi:hypothetical protein
MFSLSTINHNIYFINVHHLDVKQWAINILFHIYTVLHIVDNYLFSRLSDNGMLMVYMVLWRPLVTQPPHSLGDI